MGVWFGANRLPHVGGRNAPEGNILFVMIKIREVHQ